MKYSISQTKIQKLQSLVGNNLSDITDDLKDIANRFNNYLINIGPSLANKINDNNHEAFEKFLYLESYLSSFVPDAITLETILLYITM